MILRKEVLSLITEIVDCSNICIILVVVGKVVSNSNLVADVVLLIAQRIISIIETEISLGSTGTNYLRRRNTLMICSNLLIFTLLSYDSDVIRIQSVEEVVLTEHLLSRNTSRSISETVVVVVG